MYIALCLCFIVVLLRQYSTYLCLVCFFIIMALPSTAGVTTSGAPGGMDSMVRDLRKAMNVDEGEIDQENATKAGLERMAKGWGYRGEAARVHAYFPYDAEQPNVQLPFAGFAQGVDTNANNINDAAHSIRLAFKQSDFVDLHNTLVEVELEIPQPWFEDQMTISAGTSGNKNGTAFKISDTERKELFWWKDGGPIKLIESVEFQWLTGASTTIFNCQRGYGDLMVAGWRTGLSNQRGWERLRRRYFPMSTDENPVPTRQMMQVITDSEVWPGSDGERNMRIRVFYPLVCFLPAWCGMACQYWPIDSTYNIVITFRPLSAAVMLINAGVGEGEAPAAPNTDNIGPTGVYPILGIPWDYKPNTPNGVKNGMLDYGASRHRVITNVTDAVMNKVPTIIDSRTWLRTVRLMGNMMHEIPRDLTSPENFYFNLESSVPVLNRDLGDYSVPQNGEKYLQLYNLSDLHYPQMLCFWFYDSDNAKGGEGYSWFNRDNYKGENLLSARDSPRIDPNYLTTLEELELSWRSNEMDAAGNLAWRWRREDDPGYKQLYGLYYQNVTRLQEGCQNVMNFEEFLKRPVFLVALNPEGLADWNTGLASSGLIGLRVRTNASAFTHQKLAFFEWVRKYITVNNHSVVTVASIVSTRGGISKGLL